MSCPIEWNMTERDLIRFVIRKGEKYIEKSFDDVIKDFAEKCMTKEDFNDFLKNVGSERRI